MKGLLVSLLLLQTAPDAENREGDDTSQSVRRFDRGIY